MLIEQILLQVANKNIKNLSNVDIKGISFNSKTTQKGDVFICQKGLHVDSHDFYKEAIDNGAIAFLCTKELDCNLPQIIVSDISQAIAELANAFYDTPSALLNLIGITGTNGKTTVSHLIQNIFEKAGKTCGVIGTLGYKYSSNDDYKNEDRTTPMAPDVQKILKEFAYNKISNVAMEVSSHALVQKRVGGCLFKGAVFTNLTQDHLDYHKTMEEYCKAKTILFENIRSGGFAVVNVDDKYSSQFIDAVPERANIVYTYGIKNNADFMAKNITYSAIGSELELITPYGNFEVCLKMGGEFSVYNAMASIAAACQLGIDVKTAISSLEKTSGVAGRFETVATNPSVIIDFAHTPDGLKNALSAAKEIKASDGKLICIFGCGGDRDKTKRPKMAAIAENLADVIIISNDNPRDEEPQEIIKEIISGLKEPSKAIVIEDRTMAIAKAKEISSKRDIILLAGKGHETYQIIKGQKILYSDKAAVKDVFVK